MLLLDQGVAVEDYARWLAGYLGVPDFVYRPVIIATGSGSRELGDGLDPIPCRTDEVVTRDGFVFL